MDGMVRARQTAGTAVAGRRLIEDWLPIAALGEESMRERRFSLAGNALPPNNSLHVWWARRPLIASRAAILASVLPANTDRGRFTRALGILGDPIAARDLIATARRTGERIPDPYTWPRAFRHSLTNSDRAWLASILDETFPTVLDPTAGGGSIPFEAARLGLPTLANDLNPVATLIMRATVEWPMRHGTVLRPAFDKLARQFRTRLGERLAWAFPQHRAPDEVDTTYLWARTVRCPHCDGLVPLSPNWRLAPDGTGVQLVPHLGTGPGDAARRCTFVIVANPAQHAPGTVTDGDGLCPFGDCGRVMDGDSIKAQAQAGGMGEQLFAVVFKRRVETRTKSGKPGRDKWERGYRAPRPEDDNSEAIAARLAEKMEEWEALDYVPSEDIGDLSNYDRGHRMYGLEKWRDFFSPRQFLGHVTSVEIYNELLAEQTRVSDADELTKTAFTYLALAFDKLIDYNSRMTRWHSIREVVVNTFDSHNFAHRWSFTEMAPLVTGLGYDWVIGQVGKCVEELVELAQPGSFATDLLISRVAVVAPPVTITCGPGDTLSHIADATVDVVVMDPPYYDNVMYAELSDFFYVWLKRTAGQVVPELFTRRLTDKDAEAVANPAKFAGQKGAKALAGRDYQERMARIFAECRRVLRPDGVMTLMFTHKATGAWDALTTGLMEANFAITASWPVNTEAEGSLHIKDKSAANSTVFLVCRPRPDVDGNAPVQYWEDVEPLVAEAVRRRVGEFQAAGIGGVDLYLACFGPALEEFSRHWPLRRGTPRPAPEARRRQKQAELFPGEWDPYAATPEDALDAARREVKRWRLDALSRRRGRAELDPLCSFFVLAWDAFKAPVFPYDEGLRLARAVGVDLDRQVVGTLAEKKGSDLLLWDSGKRAAKGALGEASGVRSMMDALHGVAHAVRSRSLAAGRDAAERAGLLGDTAFQHALALALEVLPVGRAAGAPLGSDLGAASSDFEALESLRRLAFADTVAVPEQLALPLGTVEAGAAE